MLQSKAVILTLWKEKPGYPKGFWLTKYNPFLKRSDWILRFSFCALLISKNKIEAVLQTDRTTSYRNHH